MSEKIKNRYDFMLFFDVKDGNPNGDPDAGNLPRVDPETGQGLVTDVCLKRKVRNYVMLTKKLEAPYDIYVKEGAPLGQAHFDAFKEAGIEVGQETKTPIPEPLEDALKDFNCAGIRIEDDDESLFFVIESDADKKVIKDYIKEFGLKKEGSKFVNDALKAANPRKPTLAETVTGKDKMCSKFYDIRTFGAVMSLKSAPNCGQVRGPVQFTFARSIDPIVTLEHTITRCAVAKIEDATKERAMGRKNTVPYGLYKACGFVSPALANQTGFDSDDLDLLWESLKNMFEHDHSAARGMMSTCKLIIFKHDSPLGNAPSGSLFDLVKVCRKGDKEIPPRSFGDYEVTINPKCMPEGVALDEKSF